MSSRRTIRKVGPYSRTKTLARLDGRSREARFIKWLRAQLIAHVGGKPSATQLALIDLAVDTGFQLELMKRAGAGNGALTAHDHRHYIAWQNTYRRTIQQLGMKAAAEQPPDLKTYLAERAARKAA